MIFPKRKHDVETVLLNKQGKKISFKYQSCLITHILFNIFLTFELNQVQ